MKNKQIILLLIVNTLLAISTTIGMTIIPIITINAGMSMVTIGFIEGLSEFASNLMKLTSGRLYDKFRNKTMLLTTAGFLSLMSKSLLAFPTTLNILLSKLVERLSNGMFATPRDSYLSSNKNAMLLSLINITKTIGCILGSVGIGYYCYKAGSLITIKDNIITIAVTLSFIAILITVFMNIDSIQINKQSLLCEFKKLISSTSDEIKTTKSIYIIAFIFFLARFNDGLIILYLKDIGYEEWLYTSTIGIFNTMMFVFAPIFGVLLNRHLIRLTISITTIALLLFNIIMALLVFKNTYLVLLALSMWGIQRVGAQIIFTHLISLVSNKTSLGFRIGLLFVITSVAFTIMSIISGYLATINYNYVFLLSGTSTVLTLFLTNKMLKGLYA